MTGLDHAGVDRTDRDLVQPFPLAGEEFVTHRVRRWPGRTGKRMRHPPVAVVEPGPGFGVPDRLEAVQVPRGALEADRRRMMCAHRRIAAVRTMKAHDGNLRRGFFKHAHVDAVRLGPKTQQHPAIAKSADGLVPALLRDDDARPSPGPIDALSRADELDQARRRWLRHRAHPSNPATCWNHATTGGGR